MPMSHEPGAHLSQRRTFGPRLRRLLLGLAAALAVTAVLVDVRLTGPRVAVRWAAGVDISTRHALEERYGLSNGRQGAGSEWRYELRDWSHDNVEALVRDPSAADTAYIDRDRMTVDNPAVDVRLRSLPFPFGPSAEFRDPLQLFQLQSLCLLAAGTALLLIAGSPDDGRRRRLAMALVLATGAMAYAFPFEPSFLRMGDAGTYTASRASFEAYAGVREIRYEAHLSHAILGRLYGLLGHAADVPDRALNLLMRLATAWFVISAIGIGVVERWSPHVVRYLGLVMLAPAALLYFGYREIGYLSLNVAVFPLLMRGVREGTPRLEAAAALTGFGAALHGFGLLALVGSAFTALAASGSFATRLARTLTLAAWGTTAYVGWIALYLVVLKLPVILGHADAIPWRPWFTDLMVGDRVNAAVFSATGARDLLFTGWVVGAPLLAVAASMWRQDRERVRAAMCFAIPSTCFTIVFWPIQGLGVEMDLLVAAFPAMYALAWVCAHDRRHATIAAWLLASGHLAFWRIVLDGRFVN